MSAHGLLLLSAIALALANGANDTFKGVATLFGSRTTDYRKALAWATLTTAAGSLTAFLFAGALLARFSGQGLVPDALTTDPRFLTAVGGGAAITVLLASSLGAPISTTHALLGALAGAGFLASAGALRTSTLMGGFLAPLLVSPLLSVVLVGIAYPALGAFRIGSRAAGETCLCAGEAEPIEVGGGGGIALVPRARVAVVASTRVCETQGLRPALVVPRGLDLAHYLSAGAVGFARGANDTPKLLALLVPLQSAGVGWGLPVVAAAMVLGGILGSRRVADTMSHRITSMTPGQGFTANLVTAGLVLGASRLGLPVSTTHVSSGSLFGVGAVTRSARWVVVGRIVFAWLVTIPCAAACAAVLWLAMAR